MLNRLYFLKTHFSKKWPVELTFFVTSRCNFRCKHCFYWKEVEKEKKNELSLKEIEKITRGLPRLLRLLISGGEPFLRKDLSEICRAFYENTKVLHITIPTNGSLPEATEKATQRIVRNCPKTYVNIGLSLDALGKKRDRFVGVKSSFPKLQETHQRLCRLKRKYKNLAVGVITTMNAENQTDLIKIYEYAVKELEVDNFGFNVVRGLPKNRSVKNIDLSYFLELTRRITQNAKEDEVGKMNFLFSKFFLAKRVLLYDIFYKTHVQNKYQIPCYSGRIRGVINESGEVYPCETFMYHQPELKFGDLREFAYDFKKLWLSQKAEMIRKKITVTKCFCAHECDLTTNILFNFRLQPNLFKEWLKLQDWTRYFKLSGEK